MVTPLFLYFEVGPLARELLLESVSETRILGERREGRAAAVPRILGERAGAILLVGSKI